MAAAQVFTPANCEAVLKSTRHYDYPDALRCITVKVTHPQYGQLASLEALLIDRTQLPLGEFVGAMDEESDELQKFALDVFDPQARIKQRLVDHEHHKGSGCWGREFNDGRIVYVSTVEVKNQYRRKGLGTLAIKKLMNSRYVRQGDFLAAWPTAGPGDGVEMHDIAVSFFHNNGFRRIGRTQFLAYSPDPAHPSRTLAAANDAPDESEYAPHALHAPEPTTGNSAQAFALHHAIGQASRPDFVPPELIAHFPPQPTIDIAETINAAYAADPSSVTSRDENGWTPLHVAAVARNPDAIRALLSLSADAGVRAILTSRDNTQGLTPLDILERSMERGKAFVDSMLGPEMWMGYEDRAVRGVYLLKNGASEDVWTTGEKASTALNLAGMTERQKEDRFVELRRFECTCLRCVGGWLSPKMLFRLTSSAEELFALAPIDLRFTPTLDRAFFDQTLGMEYIPINVRHNVNRAWFRAWHGLFFLIAHMLRSLQDSATLQTGPTPSSILEYAQGFPAPDTNDDAASEDMRTILDRDFLAHGGLIEHALDAVVAIAKDSSPPPHGDGTWDEARAEHGDAKRAAWVALPACAHDLAFGLVRENMGIGLQGPASGPYYDHEYNRQFGFGGNNAPEDEQFVKNILQQFAEAEAAAAAGRIGGLTAGVSMPDDVDMDMLETFDGEMRDEDDEEDEEDEDEE